MGLDDFGRTVRNIRLVRALLLYDMAKDLDISPAELSAIECREKTCSRLVRLQAARKIRHQRHARSIAYQIYEGTG